MIKLISTLLVVLLLCAVAITAYADDVSPASGSDNMTLSVKELCGMSAEESLRELQQFGLVLPEAYAAGPELAKEVMETALADLQSGQLLEGRYPYSYTQLVELEKQVRDILLVHGG